jgi:tRNA threonylcarbamoyl adenosine modification protein YeaZ
VRLLALDTTTGTCSVCALASDDVLVHRSERLATGQAERIVPMIGEVMGAAGWRWKDVEVLAVGVGPGSFAGIRAGVAAARGLALAADLPCFGIGSLEALATASPSMPVLCVIAGRQGRAFVQRFTGEGRPDGLARSVDPEAAEALAVPGDRILVVGEPRPVAGEPAEIDALLVARAARARLSQGSRPGRGHELTPFYLRDSGAGAGAGRPLVGQRS